MKASLPSAPQPAPGPSPPLPPLPLEQVDLALGRAVGVVRRRARLAGAVHLGVWGAVAGAALAIAVAGATRLGALSPVPVDRVVPAPVAARLGLRGSAPLELLGLLLALGGGAVGGVVGAARRRLGRTEAYALLDAARGGALFGTLLELSPDHRFAPLVRAEAAAALPALDPRRALRVAAPRRPLRLLGGALVAILVVAHAPTRRPGLAQAREVAVLTSSQSLELERLEARLERVADDRGRAALARAADGLAELRKGVEAGELTELAALAKLGAVEEELRAERARIDARNALAKRLEDPAVRSVVAAGAAHDPSALSEPTARAAAREALRRAADDAAIAGPKVADAVTRAALALAPDAPPEAAEPALEALRRALADQPPTYSDALTRQAIEQATPKLEGVRAAFQSSRPAPTDLAQAPPAAPPPDGTPPLATEPRPSPQPGTEPSPQAGTEPRPQAGTERAPQAGTERAPQAGTERSPPQGGTERAPQAGTERAPQGGTERAPQAGTERTPPQAGTERAPQGGTEQAPQAGTERAPQGGTEQAPQAGTERAPQAGTESAPRPGSEATPPRPEDPRQARAKPPEDRPDPAGGPSEPPPELVMSLAQSLGEQLLGAMSADDLASLAELARDMKGEEGQDAQKPPTPDAMRDMADRFAGLDPALQKKLAEAAGKMRPAEGTGDAPAPPQDGSKEAAPDEAARRDMEQRLARLDPGVRRALESAARQQAANAGAQAGAGEPGGGEPGGEGSDPTGSQAGRPGTRPGEGRPGAGPPGSPGAGEPGGPEGPGGQALPLGTRGPGGAADPAGSADPAAEVAGSPPGPSAGTEASSDRPTFFPSAPDGPRVAPVDDGVIHDDEETTGGARGGSRVPFDAAVRASHDAAIEALGRQRVPETYERAVRRYFDRARRAAESSPPPPAGR